MSALRALGLAMVAPMIACAGTRGRTPEAASVVRDALTQLARGEGDLGRFTVTFDHIFALHGGLKLTIRGDGTIEQKAVRMPAGDPKDRVAPDDLRALVVHLVKHEVWVQRVDERQAVPDESRAILRTCDAGQCVEIWEWYNDLDKRGRIGDVLKLMQAVAWKPAAPGTRGKTDPADAKAVPDGDKFVER